MALRPLMCAGYRNPEGEPFVMPFPQQCVRDLDCLRPDTGIEVVHRRRIVKLAPGHLTIASS